MPGENQQIDRGDQTSAYKQKNKKMSPVTGV
jgi:hypothetical protein